MLNYILYVCMYILYAHRSSENQRTLTPTNIAILFSNTTYIDLLYNKTKCVHINIIYITIV